MRKRRRCAEALVASPPLSIRKVASALTLALAFGLAPAAHAQATEGALFLLVPVGARATALGHAGVSRPLGAEGIWWNPASIGWLTRPEVAVDYAQLEFIQGTAVELVAPAGRAGTIAVAGLSFSQGDQDATDSFGNIVGRLYPRFTVLAATYAAPFGDRFSMGVTYKFVRSSQTCSGGCAEQVLYKVSTAAIDLGVQVIADSARRLRLGAAIRNFGIVLQTIDAEQADPLPARLHIGASYTVARATRAVPWLALDLTGEIVAKRAPQDADLRVGAEARLGNQLALRAGLPTIKVFSENPSMSGDGSKAVMGVGFRTGTLSFDFASSFGGSSASAGQPPMYFSIGKSFK